MDFASWMQLSDVAGLVTMAGIVSTLPAAGHRGRVTLKDKDDHIKTEKELGPPSFDDFMALYEGLCRVRRSDFYGLQERKSVITNRDVTNRVSQLCVRAGWRDALKKKLVSLAQKKDERTAERYYPGRGLPLGGKSQITHVECEKVLKYLKKTGVIEYGSPIFEYAGHRDMLARAFAARMGKPNDGIVRADSRVVYEFYSLDVQQVLTEQGRYYLMKGCAEIETDSKLGIANIRVFQRWGIRGGGENRPLHVMDEEYEGNLFLQDDTVYAFAFKAERGPNGKVLESKSDQRKNMVSLVLQGFSRDADGFHKKLTGGQIGQGIGGTVGVLSAPCVFYRVSEGRLTEIQDQIREEDPKAWKMMSEGRNKEALAYETLKWESEFIDLLNGVEHRYAPVMADLDVPMPLPESEEKGGAQIVLGG